MYTDTSKKSCERHCTENSNIFHFKQTKESELKKSNKSNKHSHIKSKFAEIPKLDTSDIHENPIFKEVQEKFEYKQSLRSKNITKDIENINKIR